MRGRQGLGCLGSTEFGSGEVSALARLCPQSRVSFRQGVAALDGSQHPPPLSGASLASGHTVCRGRAGVAQTPMLEERRGV